MEYFLQNFVNFYPNLCDQLLHYQSTITDFAVRFAPSAWLSYDSLFYHKRANIPSSPLDKPDDDLFNRYSRTRKYSSYSSPYHYTSPALHCQSQFQAPPFQHRRNLQLSTVHLSTQMSIMLWRTTKGTIQTYQLVISTDCQSESCLSSPVHVDRLEVLFQGRRLVDFVVEGLG